MKHNLSNEELRARMDEEARAAEAAAAEDIDDGAPLPAHVKVSRPNRARNKVLQVRLTDEEMSNLEAVAAFQGLPPSTVARDALLRMTRQAMMAPEDRPDVEKLLDLIATSVAQLQHLQADSHSLSDAPIG